MPCQPLPGDTLLHKRLSARNFQFLDYVSKTEYIDVGDNIIGCVHALDGWDDDTGGYAEFVGGGIGYNYVDVKITSQLNRGFWFEIEVYGQKPRTCKYIRKCCVNFRTCPHAHTHTHTHIITADILRFTPKSFWIGSCLNDFLICPNCLCCLLIDELMNTCTYIGK